jgi:hypothetical protein
MLGGVGIELNTMPPRKKPAAKSASLAPKEAEHESNEAGATSIVSAIGASIVSPAPTTVPVTPTTNSTLNSASTHPEPSSVVAVEPSKAGGKAKREKKSTKHKVVAVVTADGIQGSFQNEVRRPLIVSLPIHSSDVQFHDQPFHYDPRPPETYDAFNAVVTDPFAEESAYEKAPERESVSQIQNERTETETEPHPTHTLVQFEAPNHTVPSTTSAHGPSTHHSRTEYGPTTLLVQFSSSKQTHELPSESSLGCFWCCETFTGRPCVVPTRVVEKVWHVYGNFCTPQCGMAYLLSEILDTHTRWERIALLHRLYSGQCSGRVYPAPSREVLQRFGGPVSGADFRAICEGQRVRVDIAQPPMVSILASMDTKPIDFYETPLRNTFASPSQYQISRATDEPKGLTLKRTKPLKDRESTLDSCFTQLVRA